jgi:hypothetical protein
MGNTWKIILATVVIFAAGALTGGLLVQHVLGLRPASADRQRPPTANWQPGPRELLARGTNEFRPPPDQQRMDFVLRAQRELRLDPKQRERIERVVTEGQERTREFWEKSQPEFRRLMQETRDRIRAELTPEQRTRFEEILRQQRPQRATNAPGTPGRGSGELRRPSPGGTDQPARPPRQAPGNRPGETQGATPQR